MGAENKVGRPPLDDSERAKPRAIRLTDADYAELQRMGMDALRGWLRASAQPPTAAQPDSAH